MLRFTGVDCISTRVPTLNQHARTILIIAGSFMSPLEPSRAFTNRYHLSLIARASKHRARAGRERKKQIYHVIRC